MKTVELFGTTVLCNGDAPDIAITTVSSSQPRILRFAYSWDIVRLAFSRRLRQSDASPVLLIPASRAAARIVSALSNHRANAVHPFQFVVRLLTHIAEHGGGRLYLLGPSTSSLQVGQANIRTTFPGLHIVGRSILDPRAAEAVATVIQKSDPQVLLNGVDSGRALDWLRKQLPNLADRVVCIHAPEVYRRMSASRGKLRPFAFLRIIVYVLFIFAFPVIRFLTLRRFRTAS